MKRNRLEIATKLLNEILTADYEVIRTQTIEAAERKKIEILADDTVSDSIKSWFTNTSHAYKSASEYKAAAIKKHFEHHAGHCAECYKPLDDLVLPLDTREKRDCGKWGFKYENVYRTACLVHTKELKDKVYTGKRCKACGVAFSSWSESNYCSLACRSWADYHQRKPQKKMVICKNCDKDFLPKRADSVFCGTNCRVTYWRMTQRQFDLFANV